MARFVSASRLALPSPLSTGCSVLDAFLAGGKKSNCFFFSRCGIAEIAGEAGAGKTQLCLRLLIEAVMSNEHAHAIYVCTEGAARTERLRDLMNALPAAPRRRPRSDLHR